MNRRILVFSDIHANLEAFEAAWAASANHGPYDAKLCAGDSVGYGSDPNTVLGRLREEGFISVIGNHDRAVRGIYEDVQNSVPSKYRNSVPDNIRVLNPGLIADLEAKVRDNPAIHGFSPSAEETCVLNALVLNGKNLEYLNSLSNAPHLDPSGAFAMVHGSFAGYIENPPEREDLVENVYVDGQREAFQAMRSLTFVNGRLDKSGVVLEPDKIPDKTKSKIVRFASYPEGTVHVPIGIVGHHHIPNIATCVLPFANIKGVYKGLADISVREYKYADDRDHIVEDIDYIGVGGERTDGIKVNFIDEDTIDIEANLNQLPKNVIGKKQPSWFKDGCEGYENFDSMLHDLFLRKFLVNPGSVGQPRNGSPKASYMVLELGENGYVKFEFRAIGYDVETTQRKLRERGYPERLAIRLGQGK